ALSPPPLLPIVVPYTTLFRSGDDLRGAPAVRVAPTLHRDVHARVSRLVPLVRRADDLAGLVARPQGELSLRGRGAGGHGPVRDEDRKSTRLNSSHVANSYAVF